MKTVCFTVAASVCLFLVLATPLRARTLEQDFREPQNARITLSLDQGWRFHPGESRSLWTGSFDDSSWQVVSIPHAFPAAGTPGKPEVYRGEAWYRKSFEARDAWKTRRVFLRFDGVSLVSEVFLNGRKLGEHRGGFAAFTFELTGKLVYGTPNQIAVRVDNRMSSEVSPLELSLLYGGIYRHVSLLITDPIDITPLDYASPGVFLTQRAVGRGRAEVEIRAEVSNGSSASRPVQVKFELRNASGELVTSTRVQASLAPGKTMPVVRQITVKHPHLWNGVADPYLYSVRVELLDNGHVLDSVTQPLGLRFFHVDPKGGFVLNGVARQIHGACLHQDWGALGWAIGPEQEEADLDILRAMGADGLRLVHYQHSQSALDLYDKTGMLIWSELAQFGKVDQSDAYRQNVRQQLIEMIRQNYNHPSIVMWSLYNELNSKTKAAALPIIKDLNTVAHAEDPTRPTVAAASGDTIANAHEIVETQDLIADNNYAGWYAKAPEDMGGEIEKWNAAYGFRGLAVSEYGGGAKITDHGQNLVAGDVKPYGKFQPEEWQALVHEGNYRAIKDHPVVWGSFLWLAFDTGGMALPDGTFEGGNIKGLVTQDRKVRKDAYFFYQANWTTRPMVYLTSRRSADRTEEKTPVKVYSNAASVSLTVNGKSYGTQTPDDLHAFRWKDVALTPGDNVVEARSADGLRDRVVWTYRPPVIAPP